ncbi:MAG TPA: zf-HC2 domain-containing protein [Candidatus Micrarchaeaceae archaeon]|nr:zf-HC2 domain-containing protein [Candidatus Micrarchaeaceae archaeon]
MNCREAQRRLPGYFDGAMRSSEHAAVHRHVTGCSDCREQLERFRRLMICLGHVNPVEPPADLATRIRVRASQIEPRWVFPRRLWTRLRMISEDILEPLAVPATGGILTALVVFVLLVQNVLVGVPMTGFVPDDQPLNLVQPARLESLGPFPVPNLPASSGDPNESGLLLEATLNAQGEVVSYKILSGPSDAAVQHQLDQVLLFSRFHPLVSFGLPMNGGRVLLNFSQVRVRG